MSHYMAFGKVCYYCILENYFLCVPDVVNNTNISASYSKIY